MILNEFSILSEKYVFNHSIRAALHFISITTVQHPHNLIKSQVTLWYIIGCLATCPGWQLNTTWTTHHLETLTLPVSLVRVTSQRSLPRSAGQTH